MRHILYILALGTALCMTGCQGYQRWFEDQKELDTIDVMLDNGNYTDAYNTIINIDSLVNGMSHEAQMRFALQKIKAEDKINQPLLTDSIILGIIDYYEGSGDKARLPEAYYYAGRTYAYFNDALRSLEYFNKALDVVNPDNVYLLSRIHSQRGYQLYNQGLYDLALEAHRKSYEFSFQDGDTIALIHCNRDIANCYTGENDFKDALYFYDKGGELALLKNDSSLYSLIGVDKANVYTYMGEYDLAEKYLNMSIEQVDSSFYDYAISVAGYFYFNKRDYNTARTYYEKLLKSPSLYFQHEGEAMLLSMAVNDRDVDGIIEHVVPYKNLTDSISFITDSETIARINSLYNSRRLEKANEKLERQNARYNNLLVIGGLLVVIIVVSLLLYSYRIRSERNRLRYNNAMLDQYFKEEQQKREQAEQERLRIQAERDKLAEDNLQGQYKFVLGDEKKVFVQESELYQKLYNSGKVISVKDLEDVKVLLDEVYPEFFFRLHSIGVVKDQVIKVSMLLKMGFAPSKIASLLSLSLSAISNIRKRTYEKVTGKVGKADDWDKIIMNM